MVRVTLSTLFNLGPSIHPIFSAHRSQLRVDAMDSHVMVHGGGFFAYTCSVLIPRISRLHRIRVLAKRGHGQAHHIARRDAAEEELKMKQGLIPYDHFQPPLGLGDCTWPIREEYYGKAQDHVRQHKDSIVQWTKHFAPEYLPTIERYYAARNYAMVAID